MRGTKRLCRARLSSISTTYRTRNGTRGWLVMRSGALRDFGAGPNQQALIAATAGRGGRRGPCAHHARRAGRRRHRGVTGEWARLQRRCGGGADRTPSLLSIRALSWSAPLCSHVACLLPCHVTLSCATLMLRRRRALSLARVRRSRLSCAPHLVSVRARPVTRIPIHHHSPALVLLSVRPRRVVAARHVHVPPPLAQPVLSLFPRRLVCHLSVAPLLSLCDCCRLSLLLLCVSARAPSQLALLSPCPSAPRRYRPHPPPSPPCARPPPHHLCLALHGLRNESLGPRARRITTLNCSK